MTTSKSRNVTVDDKRSSRHSRGFQPFSHGDGGAHGSRQILSAEEIVYQSNWSSRWKLADEVLIEAKADRQRSHYRIGILAAKDFFYIIQEDITNATYAPSLH